MDLRRLRVWGSSSVHAVHAAKIVLPMQLERTKGNTARINGLLVSCLGHTLSHTSSFQIFSTSSSSSETSYFMVAAMAAMAGSDPDPMSTAWR